MKTFLPFLAGCLLSLPLFVQAEDDDRDKPATVPPPPKEVTDLYRKISPDQIKENPFKLIGQDWMLISAGNEEKFNGMTASWGGFGVWRHPVVFILVYNTRYTYEFLEREDYFTLSFFDEKYKSKLEMYGHKSGRDTDKLKEAGFTALSLKPSMAYKEARMIIQCKKIYADRTRAECWLPPRGETSSPSDGAHKLYFGEVLAVWVKK